MIDNWLIKSPDVLVQKEIIKCSDKYNELIKKVGSGAYIPTDDIIKTREIISKLIFNFMEENS